MSSGNPKTAETGRTASTQRLWARRRILNYVVAQGNNGAVYW
jgi:hypothetical protein